MWIICHVLSQIIWLQLNLLYSWRFSRYSAPILNVSLGFVTGNIEILGKQNSLFPSGPVIKCLMNCMWCVMKRIVCACFYFKYSGVSAWLWKLKTPGYFCSWQLTVETCLTATLLRQPPSCYMCMVWIKAHSFISLLKVSARVQDRPRADRCSAFISRISPDKPYILWKLNSSRLWIIPLKISKSKEMAYLRRFLRKHMSV